MKKPDFRQRHEIKTNIKAYRFSAGRAAESRRKREGTARPVSKLPTTLDELRKHVDDVIYRSEQPDGDALGRLLEKKK